LDRIVLSRPRDAAGGRWPGPWVRGLQAGVAASLALALAACGTDPPPQNSYLAPARPVITADVQPRRPAAPDAGAMDQPLAKSTPKETAATLARLARKAVEDGNLEGAVQLYQRSLALDPAPLPVTLGLADALYRSGDYRNALEAYRQALRIDPVSDEAMRGRGKTLIALDRPHEAVDQYRAVVKRLPQDHRALNGLGVALDMTGAHGEAQEQYRKAMALAPNDVSLQNNLALSLALSRRFEQSLDILTKLVNSPASTARNRQNLALVYGLLGDEQRAAEIARQDLSDEQVQRNLAYYAQLRQLNDPQRSAAVFNTDTRRLPELPDRRHTSALPGADPAAVAGASPAAGSRSPDPPPPAGGPPVLPGGWRPVDPPAGAPMLPPIGDAAPSGAGKPAAENPMAEKPAAKPPGEQTSALPARPAARDPAVPRTFLEAVLAAPQTPEAMPRHPVMTTPAEASKDAAADLADPPLPPFSDLAN
jgi:Flp pilus assembly protein TadD